MISSCLYQYMFYYNQCADTQGFADTKNYILYNVFYRPTMLRGDTGVDKLI